MDNSRSGFTLVEVIIAITFLAVGLLGLLGATAATIRVLGESDRTVTVAFQASQQLENLEALGCDAASSGTNSFEGIDMKWTVGGAPTDNTRPVVLVASYPLSRGRSRVDTFEKVLQCVR